MTQVLNRSTQPESKFSSSTKIEPEKFGFPKIAQEWTRQLRYAKGHPVLFGGKTWYSTTNRNWKNVPSLESKHWTDDPNGN